MINGNVNEFVDNLHIGIEMMVRFANIDFFIQGWNEDNKYHLERWNYKDVFDSNRWSCDDENSDKCVKEFLEAPMWNGQKFYDVENSIEWIDWY